MDFPPVDFCARLDPHAFAALVGAPPPVSVVSPVDDAHHGAPSADGVVLDDAPVRAKTKGAHNVVVALPAAPGKHSASALSSKGKLSEHYTLGHALGKGSFGQVFKARRVADGRSVAVKVISKGAFKKSTDHDILMNEVALMRAVKGGPNVLQLHDFFEEAGAFYIVCDVCEGGDLMGRLASHKTLSEADVARYCRQILRALQWCHSKGVVHRDLKPENFLLTTAREDAEVVLADFGLSSRVAHASSLMHDGCGSPIYMAPEIFSGSFTLAIDAWSLGVNLYVMLTGTFPFGSRARSSDELFASIQRDPIAWTEQTATLSLAVRQLIIDLLEKNPARRLTIEGALARPWVSGGAAVDVPLDRRLFEGLCAFNARNRFRRHAIQLVASAFTPEEVVRLGDHFRRINVDGSGFITRPQLVEALRSINSVAASTTIAPEAFAELLESSVDTDRDGRISWQEFLEAATEQLIQRTQMDLWWAFCAYDTDRDGRVSVDELRAVLKGESAETVEAYIREYDVDGDGKISYEEFVRMMRPGAKARAGGAASSR